MVAQKTTKKPAPRTVRATRVAAKTTGDMGSYLRRIFGLMGAAVGVSAITAALTIFGGGIYWFINATGTGFSALYYVILFGGLGLSIWAQARAFSLKPTTAILLLGLYAILMGFAMTPLIWATLAVNPVSILMAFVIAAVMFACMALFGYKTVKDLSFLGTFLFIGMIGLILVGLASLIWPLGTGFATFVCAAGVLIFALFAAYDMQSLKRAYYAVGNDTQKNQLAVLGALHMYISFIAMFEYILSLLNRNN
ncbi:Bax inhibitor-1/YccA family protein [bacterium]|nr:Bax inhibitor-1/YccA family protein [bacterium]